MGANSGDGIFSLSSEPPSDAASAQGLGRFSTRRAPWRVQATLAMNRAPAQHRLGTQPIRVDVRVIAATNRDLNAVVDSGSFREDLFYRLNVFPLVVPPLRERGEDIPVLVEYFINLYARNAGKTFRRINKRTLDRLRSYPWQGNVREVQNVIER